MENHPPNLHVPHFPHVMRPPHHELNLKPFYGQLLNFNAILGSNPAGTLQPYHDVAFWVNDDEFQGGVHRFFTEYHINPHRLLLWANAMDMELAHTNVSINLWTMDLDIQAEIWRPAIPPFNYPRPTLHYRSLYPLPVGFYNPFSAVYIVRNSTIYICLYSEAGVGEIPNNYVVPRYNQLNQIPAYGHYQPPQPQPQPQNGN